MRLVGYRTGKLVDPARRAWDDQGPRPMYWSAWYPASDGSPTGLAEQPFEFGPVALDAPLAHHRHPVVLLSHGTGGTAESLGWLAAQLAQDGYIVLGANHHGNSGVEPYRAEGFLCWWERAADLSFLLTELSSKEPFGERLDLSRVSSLGFSLGGYTVLVLLGARTSMARFTDWADGRMVGPREFPDVADYVEGLLAGSGPFRASWERQEKDYADARIRGAIAIAAAPSVRGFDPSDVAAIDRPVTLITGEADREAPTADCAAWLLGLNQSFHHVSVGAAVGHYQFLGQPTDLGRQTVPHVFVDPPEAPRDQVHASTLAAVRAFLRE